MQDSQASNLHLIITKYPENQCCGDCFLSIRGMHHLQHQHHDSLAVQSGGHQLYGILASDENVRSGTADPKLKSVWTELC